MKKTENNDKEYCKIYATTDYSKFKFVEWNRMIKLDHVEKMMESLKNGMYSIPILVDETYRVLDGQHRLIACQKLGIPILYTIEKSKHESKQIILALNTRTKVWSLMDYINAYAKAGYEHYQKAIDFIKEYKEFRYSRMFICFLVYGTDHICYEDIKKGNFKIKDLKLSKKMANDFLDIRFIDGLTVKKLDVCKNMNLFCAIFQLLKNKNITKNNLKIAINKYPEKIYKCITVTGYKQMLCEVYNYNKSKKNQINM